MGIKPIIHCKQAPRINGGLSPAKLQDMTDRQNTVTPASVLPSGKWIDAASME